MLVGLNLFSMICMSVARSTPGSIVSTESIIPDALSLILGIRGSAGFNIPSAFGSTEVCYTGNP